MPRPFLDSFVNSTGGVCIGFDDQKSIDMLLAVNSEHVTLVLLYSSLDNFLLEKVVNT